MRSRQLSHDPASTLSTCTVAHPCGFSLTTESPPSRSSRGRSVPRRPVLLGTAFASAAAHTGHSPAFVFSLTYRARASERSAPPDRSPLRERGSAHGIWSFAVLLRRASGRENSASTHLPFARPCRAWDFFFPGIGRCVRSCICRPVEACRSRLLGVPACQPCRPDTSGAAATALDFSSSRVIGRDSRWRCPIACRRGSRHLAPATGSRPLRASTPA